MRFNLNVTSRTEGTADHLTLLQLLKPAESVWFLVATKRIYMSVCPSVGPSVGPLVILSLFGLLGAVMALPCIVYGLFTRHCSDSNDIVH